MAEKVATIVLNVDLDCPKCYKKVRKTLCKFHEIRSWSFDEKQKKVFISGPFNPECLIKKLYCKIGCKIIKGHEIIIPKPPPPPPPKKPDPPKEPPNEEPRPPPPKKPDPPKEEAPKKPAGPPNEEPPPPPPKKPDPPKEEPPKKPAGPPPPPPPAEPVCVGPPGPICCCRPCYEGRPWDGYCRRGRVDYYYDTCCRDCYEGRPWDGPCTRGGYDRGCRFFSEEDSSCRTM